MSTAITSSDLPNASFDLNSAGPSSASTSARNQFGADTDRLDGPSDRELLNVAVGEDEEGGEEYWTIAEVCQANASKLI